MAKRNNSWNKVNDLTNTVTVFNPNSKKKSWFIFLIVFTIFIPIIAGSVFLLSSILEYSGINTSNNNPDIKENNYISINLGKTPMHDLNFSYWNSDIKQSNINDHLHLIYDKLGNITHVYSTSLRLQYVYQQVIFNMPTFITDNNIYKLFYPKKDGIKVMDIYYDWKKAPLSESYFRVNHYDSNKFDLYVKISYNSVPQSALIDLPVQIIGVSSFYSKFFKFKLADYLKHDSKKGLMWYEQTPIYGSLGTNVWIKNLSSSVDLYNKFTMLFNNFYNCNLNTEFFDSNSTLSNVNNNNNFNPYSNFLLSNVSNQDYLSLLNEKDTFDDNNYLFDANAVISSDSNSSFKNQLASLIVFLKNIIPCNSGPLVVDKWSVTNLKGLSIFNNIYANNKIVAGNEVYFMFFPPEFNLTDYLTNSVFLHDAVKIITNKGDINKFLDNLKNDLINNKNNIYLSELEKYFPFFPFEDYDIMETYTGNTFEKKWQYEKYRVEINNNFSNNKKLSFSDSFSIIDHPSLFTIDNKTVYDFSNDKDILEFMNNFFNMPVIINIKLNNNTFSWDDVKKIIIAYLKNIISSHTNIKITNTYFLLDPKNFSDAPNFILSRVINYKSITWSQLENYLISKNNQKFQNFTTVDAGFNSPNLPSSLSISNKKLFLIRCLIKYSYKG